MLSVTSRLRAIRPIEDVGHADVAPRIVRTLSGSEPEKRRKAVPSLRAKVSEVEGLRKVALIIAADNDVGGLLRLDPRTVGSEDRWRRNGHGQICCNCSLRLKHTDDETQTLFATSFEMWFDGFERFDGL